jgi:hypothetical protein
MKKTIMAVATTLITATAMAEVTPFVGLEREVNAATNRAMVGVGADLGPVNVEAKYNWTAPNTTKFEGEKVDVDLSMSIGDNADVYMKNELTTSFKHNATVVGVKVSF